MIRKSDLKSILKSYAFVHYNLFIHGIQYLWHKPRFSGINYTAVYLF